MVTYCSIGFGFSIWKLCTNYSYTGMNFLWLIAVLYFPLFYYYFFIYLFFGMLLWYVIIFQQKSWISFSIIWKFGCHIVWESSYGLLYLQLLTLKKKGNRELWKAKASLSYVLDMGMTCFFFTMPVCLHKMLDHYACLLSCCLSSFYKNMEALHFFTGWHEWSSNLGYWDFFYGL